MVGALDPDCLAAESDVDRTLIAIALERSPSRGLFGQQMPRRSCGSDVRANRSLKPGRFSSRILTIATFNTARSFGLEIAL